MPSERDSFWGRIKNPHGASGLTGLFLGLDWIEGLQCNVAQKAPRFFELCKIHTYGTLTGKGTYRAMLTRCSTERTERSS